MIERGTMQGPIVRVMQGRKLFKENVKGEGDETSS